MKKLILSICALFICTIAIAQDKVLIKAGTIVSLQAAQTVNAADLNEGQIVDFVTVSPLTVEGENCV